MVLDFLSSSQQADTDGFSNRFCSFTGSPVHVLDHDVIIHPKPAADRLQRNGDDPESVDLVLRHIGVDEGAELRVRLAA